MCRVIDDLTAGRLSSVELVERVLANIEAADRVLNATVTVNRDAALQDAARADERRRSGDQAPLLGVPITIKDSLDTAGLRTTCGSVVRADHVPERDATVVARLRAAGAIFVAKSNLPEYQWRYETDNALRGRTLNPLDLERTPGGSSGGEAALLGADASLVGIGSDGGGSIRVPAHFCGVVGLRPTAGLVPETGIWPPSRATGMIDRVCVGPMARYVEDLWPLLRVIAGPDDVDPFVAGAPLADPPGKRCLRVGWYVDDGVLEPTDATRAAVATAAEALAAGGHQVTPAPPPDVTEATDLFFGMMAADGGARARADLMPAGEAVHPAMTVLLERLAGNALSAADYFALAERSFALRARVRAHMQNFDVLLCPVAAVPAPHHGSRPGSTSGASAYNTVHTFAVAGLPSVSVPVGQDGHLPIGLQVVANAFHDRVALAAAQLLEDEFGGFAALPAGVSRDVAPGSI